MIKIDRLISCCVRSFNHKAFKTFLSDLQQLEALIKGFTNRAENKSFLIHNFTYDFLAIITSGNPISVEGLVGMYDMQI